MHILFSNSKLLEREKTSVLSCLIHFELPFIAPFNIVPFYVKYIYYLTE